VRPGRIDSTLVVSVPLEPAELRIADLAKASLDTRPSGDHESTGFASYSRDEALNSRMSVGTVSKERLSLPGR